MCKGEGNYCSAAQTEKNSNLLADCEPKKCDINGSDLCASLCPSELYQANKQASSGTQGVAANLMSISKDVVLQLAKDCLPGIVAYHQTVDEDDALIGYSEDAVAAATSSMTTKNIRGVQQLCRLWAGKGSVYKVSLQNVMIAVVDNNKNTRAECKNYEFVIKHINAPPKNKPLSIGDRRKVNSYIVEANFYRHLAASLRQQPYQLALPQPYLVVSDGGGGGDDDDSNSDAAKGDIIICMSYLDGQDWCCSSRSGNAVHFALDWLATFHASQWDCQGISTGKLDRLVANACLHPVGSYWHLDTRPDEHASMSRRGWEGRLKLAARAIDDCLRRDPMQCLIHGDPKSANIMAMPSSRRAPSSTPPHTLSTPVAFYDFQYCGKGCPTRDLAYFFCTSCDEENEAELVAYYHSRLVEQLQKQQKQQPPASVSISVPTLTHLHDSLEIAYADFCRFMAGWGYWGFDVQDRVKALLDRLDGGKCLESEKSYDDAIRKVFW